MKFEDCEILIVDGGPDRDGLGLELWYNDIHLLEIFRDDEKKIQTFSSYQHDLQLELVEAAIKAFKERIPEEYDPSY